MTLNTATLSCRVVQSIVVLFIFRISVLKQEESFESVAKAMGWHCVRLHKLSSLEDVKKAANALDSQSEHPEGFVVCDANFHRFVAVSDSNTILDSLSVWCVDVMTVDDCCGVDPVDTKWYRATVETSAGDDSGDRCGNVLPHPPTLPTHRFWQPLLGKM